MEIDKLEEVKKQLKGAISASYTDNVVTNLLTTYIKKDLQRIEAKLESLSNNLDSKVSEVTRDHKSDKELFANSQIITRKFFKDTLDAVDSAIKNIEDRTDDVEDDYNEFTKETESKLNDFKTVLSQALSELDAFSDKVNFTLADSQAKISQYDPTNAIKPTLELIEKANKDIASIKERGKELDEIIEDLKGSKEITKQIAEKLKTLKKDDLSSKLANILEFKSEVGHKHKIADIRGLQEALNSSGGGGAVDSVNGQTGVVVLDATDVGADPAGSASTLSGSLDDVAFTGDYADLVNTPSIPDILDDLTDVTIATPADGQVLTYDSGTSTWVNEAPGGGGTWGSITGTLSDQTDLQGVLDDKLEDITGLVTQGTNVTITGTGTAIDPYEISASGGSSITGSDTQVLFFDGANNPAGDAGMTFNKTSNVMTVGGVTTNVINSTALEVTGTLAGIAALLLRNTSTNGASGTGILFYQGGNNRAQVAFTRSDLTMRLGGISTNVNTIITSGGGVDAIFVETGTGNVGMGNTGPAVKLDVTGEIRASTAGTNSNSVVTNEGTQTLTNKRITKRTGTATSSATPTINTNNVDFYSLTAQAADITSFTTNLSGTPTEAQTLWIAITDNGTARAITWGASFEASTVALPTTTVISTRLDVGFIWNTVTSKWRCIASS